MLWIIPLAIFLCVLVYQWKDRAQVHRNGQPLRRPPDTLPILGNAIKFLSPREVLFDWFIECQRQFGNETFEISVPTLPRGVVISDAKNLEFVLKNESITKGEFFRQRSWDLFGYGIINADGELWKAQRKAGLKFFGGTNLEALIEEVLPEVYEQTRAQLLECAQQGTELDLQKVFLDLTTRVMGFMAYDMDIDASSPFSRAFDYASDRIGLRFQNPLYSITEVFTGSKFHTALAEVKRFGNQIVKNAKKRRGNTAFESLITNEAAEPEHTLIHSLIDAFPNPTIVADAALNFLSAGRDTTAQSLTWTFYELMRHPKTIDFVKVEFPTNNTKSTLSSLQPSGIPRLTALFAESLRLHPPVPFEIKQTQTPLTLPDGTFLPAHSVIVWCIYAMNRSTILYGEDAHLFRPSRWLDSSEKFVGRTAFEYPVFNGGSRACLGRKMAEVIAAWLVGRVAGEFQFEEILFQDENGKVKERLSQNSLTLPMEGGLPCRVRRRQM